jgi:hypothetical protein
MNIDDEMEARKVHKKIIGKRLIDGANVFDETLENPALIFGYKRLKQDVEEFRLD